LKAVTYQIPGNFDNPLIEHVSDQKAIPRGRKDPHPKRFASRGVPPAPLPVLHVWLDLGAIGGAQRAGRTRTSRS